MVQTKDLEKPEVGEEPKFFDDNALEGFLHDIDEAAGSAFENPDEAVAYLKDFFIRNFGKNLITQEERCRRQQEAKRQRESKLKQEA